MKIIITFFLLFFLCAKSKNSFGQLKIYNQLTASPDSSILFIGMVNQLIISGKTKGSKLSLTSNTSVTKINDTCYLLRTSLLNLVDVKVYDIAKNKKLLCSTNFRTEYPKPPKGYLTMSVDSIISIAAIAANPAIYIKVPNMATSNYYRAINFALTINKANGTTIAYPIPAIGNVLNDTQLQYIKTLTSGDKLSFDNIIVTCPDCRNFKLEPFNIYIK